MHIPADIRFAATGTTLPAQAVTVHLVDPLPPSVPAGRPLPATILRWTAEEALIEVMGHLLRVRPTAIAATLHSQLVTPQAFGPNGSVPAPVTVLIHQPASSTRPTGRGEIPPPRSPAAATDAAIVPLAPPVIDLVDILETTGDGRIRIRCNEQILTAHADPTVSVIAGTRQLVRLEPSQGEWRLMPVGLREEDVTSAALALLRRLPAADLGATVPLLRQQLMAAVTELRQGGQKPPPEVVHLLDTLNVLVPNELRSLNSTEIKQWLEYGGLQSEARQTAAHLSPVTPSSTQSPPVWDLKQALVQFIERGATPFTGQGGEGGSIPAIVHYTLLGIESLQAANLGSAAVQGHYWIQLPFPDEAEWRTIYLAWQREQTPGESQSGSFRVLIHAPLASLGNIWIDMRLGFERLRAVLYCEKEITLQQVTAELKQLEQQLRDLGFIESYLEVQPADRLPRSYRVQAQAMVENRPAHWTQLDVEA